MQGSKAQSRAGGGNFSMDTRNANRAFTIGNWEQFITVMLALGCLRVKWNLRWRSNTFIKNERELHSFLSVKLF